MSFDSYSWPAPWESTNNKKNPFDTKQNTSNNDTSAFDDVNKWQVLDTSIFNTNENTFWQIDGKSFDIEKKSKKQEWFIYFNPEWLISTRKQRKRTNKLVKKHLVKKYKILYKKDEKIIDLISDIKKDLKKKEYILEKDRKHNLHVEILRQKWNTKKQILSILNKENKPKFIKYERNYEAIWLNRKVAQTAIALVEKKDNLWAIHCTDWVNRIYKKVAHERVYDSHTIFNWVKHISKWTWIWAEKYAPKSVISSIKPGEHIMVDFPVDWKYNNWKTHSVIALSKPKDWLVDVASYPSYWAEPVIEMYDLYWLNRAKSAKPIRIQSA